MIIFLLAWVAMSYVCYDVAKQKGLDSNFWAVLGLLFGFFSLIFLVMIPSKK